MGGKNGIYKFARKMFKADFRHSKLYIALNTLMIAIMFNLINISYYSIYTLNNVFHTEVTPRFIEGPGEVELEIVKIPISLIQKQNLLIVIILIMLFAAICNMSFIKRKGKEVAFIIANGASLIDVVKYLLYISGKCYLIAVSFGMPLGIAMIPLFNFVINQANGRTGSLFTLSSEAMYLSLMFLVMQCLIMVTLSFGFIVKKEVRELMFVDKTIDMEDKRQVKIPGVVFFILYLIPIVVFFIFGNYKGIEEGTKYLGYISLVSIYGMFKYFIPKVVNWLKKKTWMYKGTRRIYISNFVYSLSNSMIYAVAFVFSVIYFTADIIKYGRYNGVTAIDVLSIFSCSLVIGGALLYKLLSDTNEKMYLYWQLKTTGYSKEHILGIVNKESILFFIIATTLPLIIILCNIGSYQLSGFYDIKLSIIILLLVTVPTIIIAILSSIINRSRVKEKLYENKKGLTEIVR